MEIYRFVHENPGRLPIFILVCIVCLYWCWWRTATIHSDLEDTPPHHKVLIFFSKKVMYSKFVKIYGASKCTITLGGSSMRSPLFPSQCNCIISFFVVVNKHLTGRSPSSTFLSCAGKTARLHPRVWMQQQAHKGNATIQMAFALQPFLHSWLPT